MKIRIAGVAALCALVVGCTAETNRPKVAPVSGVVSQKGKPLTGGDVMFTPTQAEGAGNVATGQIGSDGSYRLTTFNTGDGAVLGKHKATVVARSAGDLEKMNKMKTGAIAYKLPPSLVSPKYSQVASTPLTYTVEDKSNTINIELPE